jgi:acyl-homoserine lactone acylase PvdQ
MGNSQWGALASYGSRRMNGTKKLYGTYGNSFAAAVEFGDRVRAKSILVGGQSNDPESGHFVDQVPRYVNQNWKDVAFYREDVEAREAEHYVPGKRH